MAFNVNYFGKIPINPDVLPEGEPTGQATFRPIGFTFKEMFKMYWNTKRFDINISVINPADALLAFTASGGTTGTAMGAIIGLSSAADEFKGGSSALIGKTSISHTFSQKFRLGKKGVEVEGEEGEEVDIFTMETLETNNPLRSLRLDPEKKHQKLQSNISEINEGTLCSPGPIHKLTTPTGQIIIDLSSIIMRRNLYYPKIIINMIKGQVSSALHLGGLTSGGVSFFNGGLVILSTGVTSLSGVPSFVSGSVSFGQDCCDKFFYDGKDEERKKECNC